MATDDLPFRLLGVGQRTPFGTLIPPGGRVAAYVRSTGLQTGDDLNLANMLVTNLDAGLARCRSGMNDIVVVLAGHAESITGADFMSSLVAGTRIIGTGTGTNRPTFTWTATAASFLFDVANVEMHNCILNLAGPRTSTTALTVTAPITVSAAGCALVGNEINFAVDPNQLSTVGVTTTAGATFFRFVDNDCFGATDSQVTTFLRLVGTDHFKMFRNRIVGATSSVVVGPVQFITTDSLFCQIEDNWIANNLAASSAAVSVSAGATSSSGFVNKLFMSVLDDAANNLVLGDAVGAWGLSAAAFTFGREVYVANDVAQRMGEVTVVSS